MRDVIHISAPYVQHVESEFFGEGVRLCADVSMKNPNTGVQETRVLFFEFERRFQNYLSPERSDAFVMGLLSTALENDYDITFEAPMSERLFYNISDEYIPGITKYYAKFPIYPIKLSGPLSSESLVLQGGGGGSNRLFLRSRLSLHGMQDSQC